MHGVRIAKMNRINKAFSEIFNKKTILIIQAKILLFLNKKMFINYLLNIILQIKIIILYQKKDYLNRVRELPEGR